MLQMPPNYRQQQGKPLSRAERKGAVVLASFTLACGLGAGTWALTNGFGTSNQQKCVNVVIGSATGGGSLHQCGRAARDWCVTESKAAAPIGPEVAKACKQDGFLGAG